MNKRALFCFALILAAVPCLAKGKKTAMHIKVLKVDQGTEKITPSNKQQTNCVGGTGPSISRPGSVSCVGNGLSQKPVEQTATTYRIEAVDGSSDTSVTFSCSGVKVTECPPLKVGQQYDAEMDSDSIWVTVQIDDGKKTKTVHAHYALVQIRKPDTAASK